MPRGEGGINPSDPSSSFYDNKTSSSTTTAPTASRTRALGVPKFTDPQSQRRAGDPRGFLFNPILRAKNKVRSLINQKIDSAMESLVNSYDPLGIGKKDNGP